MGRAPRFNSGGVRFYPDIDEIIKLEHIAIHEKSTADKIMRQVLTEFIERYEAEHGKIDVDELCRQDRERRQKEMQRNKELYQSWNTTTEKSK